MRCRGDLVKGTPWAHGAYRAGRAGGAYLVPEITAKPDRSAGRYDPQQSLKKQPTHERLILKKDAEDQKFLFSILNNKKISSLLDTPDSLKQLWDVCRIPDYQSISEEKHTSLLIEIFIELKKNNWLLTELFLKKNIDRLKDYSGSIDDLIYTLNETRIWLYITNQKQWIPNNS